MALVVIVSVGISTHEIKINEKAMKMFIRKGYWQCCL